MTTLPVQVGDIIDGRYRVERVLGRGGMGVVAAARHVRLRQRVAIKFPLAALVDRHDVVERMLREARATMRLRSEHVARVLDVGLHPSSGPYLVLEYLVGSDLSQVLARLGSLPLDVALDYVLQACEALAEAHRYRIIHRDIKPANLFLCDNPDGSALIKVIDFGLAKQLSAEANTTLTRSGTVLGSPLFMAPEQMRGTTEVDARADTWALGATLYTLLASEPPFPGKSSIDVYERIRSTTPKLCERRPELPRAIEGAILRCLRIDPESRYANVAEVADALAAAAPQAQVRAERVRRILERASDADATADGETTSDARPGDAASALNACLTASPRDASWQDAAMPPLTEDQPTNVSLSMTSAGVGGRGRAQRTWLVGVSAGMSILAMLAAARWRHERSAPHDYPALAASSGPIPTTPQPVASPSAPVLAPLVNATAIAPRPLQLRPPALPSLRISRRHRATPPSTINDAPKALTEQDPLADPD